MSSQQSTHIPAGCISVPRDEVALDHEIWNREDLKNWKWLVLEEETLPDLAHHDWYLDSKVQKSLLKASALSQYARLFRAHWIKLEFKVNSDAPDYGIVRVYLLPDDVQRRVVDRSNPLLRKLRRSILDSLDYSRDAWHGRVSPDPINAPVSFDSADSLIPDCEVSLLQLFNTIPSPSPAPDSIVDAYAKDVMNDLLNSKVPGLLTTLYPYQGRSAALMLQKEVQSGTILDPRLMHVQDQQGSEWYLDPVANTVLKGPRYYDGVSGGILAEEMGSGKTIICLALILATKGLPTRPPELYGAGEVPIRKRVGCLADMAASCATRNAVPWRSYFEAYKTQLGEEFGQCIETLKRNPGHYFVPAPEPRRAGRNPTYQYELPKKIYLSTGSVIVVPNNLVTQWKQELRKHTDGLSVLTLSKKEEEVPTVEALLGYDIVLFSQTRFDVEFSGLAESPLSRIHFKRCIVDEGHKLGNSRIGYRSNLLIGLDALHFSSRWIVTGTPSHGLYGVDTSKANTSSENTGDDSRQLEMANETNKSSVEMEKQDLERIGSIAALYLKARPWANTMMETGDTLADWTVYLMLPKHNSKSRGRRGCLRSTLNSLIIRHRWDEVGDLLPPVDKKVVVLDGSYQDRLSLNVFSMMIIFNSIQSQRTDADYFFHPRQRQSVLRLAINLKQACFFGGSFFTLEEISSSVETAERFLRDGKVPISADDRTLLEQAIEIGHSVMGNKLRKLSNQFHEVPVLVEGFPSYVGQSWSLDGESNNPACTSASMLLSLQKQIFKSASQREEPNSLLNGRLIQEGMDERERMLTAQSAHKPSEAKEKGSKTLAGNTKLGDDSPKKVRSHGVNGIKAKSEMASDVSLGLLEETRITATASAKLSYLIDSVVKYQKDEKIIIFYENENVAWYLASMLDVLQIQHLIYARSLLTERRAQYVNTFHHNPSFRVLLMDLSQAAFGLDMREGSRIYFINPVLNPQVEAQAIGRVRRISQQKLVSVETLVLKNSIEEVILERKEHMTQAEHRRAKSIVDIRPIHDWIKKAKIVPLPEDAHDDSSQMAPLHTPQYVFGAGFGRTLHPDDGIVLDDPARPRTGATDQPQVGSTTRNLKRTHDEVGPGGRDQGTRELAARPPRRVRFTVDSDDG